MSIATLQEWRYAMEAVLFMHNIESRRTFSTMVMTDAREYTRLPPAHCERSYRSTSHLCIALAALMAAASIFPSRTQAQSNTASQNFPDKSGEGAQRPLQQLRMLAEMIRKCPSRDAKFSDGSGYHTDAPLNVIWDVEQSKSARSSQIGYVEFVQNVYSLGKPQEVCKKKDTACNDRNYWTAVNNLAASTVPADQNNNLYRFVFDIGPQGLEFSQSLKKPELADASHWMSAQMSGCEADAVAFILGHGSQIGSPIH